MILGFQKLMDSVNCYMKHFAFDWQEVPFQRVGCEEKRIKRDNPEQETVKYVRTGKLCSDEKSLLKYFLNMKTYRNYNEDLDDAKFLDVKIIKENDQLSVTGERKLVEHLFEYIIEKLFSQPQSLRTLSAKCIIANPDKIKGKTLLFDVEQIKLWSESF
jgi:hypothetical protein